MDLSDIKSECKKLKITQSKINIIEKRYFKSKYVFQDFWNDYFKKKKNETKKTKKLSTFIPKTVNEDLDIKKTIQKTKSTREISLMEQVPKKADNKTQKSKENIIQSAKKVPDTKTTNKNETKNEPFEVNNVKKKINKKIHSELPIISKAKKYPSTRRFKDETIKSGLSKKKSIFEQKLFNNKSKSNKRKSKRTISSTKKINKSIFKNSKEFSAKSTRSVQKKKGSVKVDQISGMSLKDRKKSLLNELKKNSSLSNTYKNNIKKKKQVTRSVTNNKKKAKDLGFEKKNTKSRY